MQTPVAAFIVHYSRKIRGDIMTKIKEHKNGAYTSIERLFPSGMYLVMLYSPSGHLMDKIRTDTYSAAREYFSAFNKIAKNYGVTA